MLLKKMSRNKNQTYFFLAFTINDKTTLKVYIINTHKYNLIYELSSAYKMCYKFHCWPTCSCSFNILNSS